MEKNYLKRNVFIPTCRHCQSKAKRQQSKFVIPIVVFQIQRKCYCKTLSESLRKLPETVIWEEELYPIYDKNSLRMAISHRQFCFCNLFCSRKSQDLFASIQNESESHKKWFSDIVQFRFNHLNDCFCHLRIEY